MHNYLTNKPKTFANKSLRLQKLINEAIYILDNLGIPIQNQTERRLERMALVFLAVIDKNTGNTWKSIKDINDYVSLKTRDIIAILNSKYEENLSRGSYDDIRRKDLKLLVLANIIVSSNPTAAKNDSTRGYGLNPLYTNLISSFGTKNWANKVKASLKGTTLLKDKLAQVRSIQKIDVQLPSGKQLNFSLGKHNELQKAIVEEFLPRYGYGAEVLYIGDTADKFLHLEKEKLDELNFFELSDGELPDIVAFSVLKKWIYLIEAVHSSGSINRIRQFELEKLTNQCGYPIVYVTAFLNRATFRKFVAEIAWQTEVWIADSPDHLIHFNGGKFLGPYEET